MSGHLMVFSIIALVMMVPPAPNLFAQVVINEVMQNPDFTPDSDGEWFELYNSSDTLVDINGWVVRDDGSNYHVITNGEPLEIASGTYLVLGRTDDPAFNGNVPVAYSYGSDISLGNGQDQLILEDSIGNEIDRVEYDDGKTFPDPTGASMELIHPDVDNNIGSFWDTARESWDGNDFGTPGHHNSVLDTIPPSLSEVLALSLTQVLVRFSESVDRESAEQVTNYFIEPDVGYPVSATLDSTDGTIVRLLLSPIREDSVYSLTVSGVRDIVGNSMSAELRNFIYSEPSDKPAITITEIMSNPDSVSDANGEWFEVYNPTPDSVDMNGWTITDDNVNTFVVQTSFIIPPFDFGLFTVNTDSLTNGGFSGCPVYDWGSSSTFTLGNSTDKIIIRDGKATIDSVSYDPSDLWPEAVGASIGLSAFDLDNNSGESWSIAEEREPSFSGHDGDLGSPGSLGGNQSLTSDETITVTPTDLTFVTGHEEFYSQQLILHNNGKDTADWSAIDTTCIANTMDWISVCPESGETPPLSSDTIMVTADAGLLPAGNYICNLIIEIEPGAKRTDVPVTLAVLDTPIVGMVMLPPDSLPIPPSGRIVPMELTVTNLTGVRRDVDLWISLRIPGRSEPRVIRTTWHPLLQPFDSVEKTRDISIPPFGPAGIYELKLHLGVFPDTIEFEDSFEFEKVSEEISFTEQDGLAGEFPRNPFLSPGYPNPFNSTSEIQYGISEDTWVTLKVYNSLGQEIRTLVDEYQEPGRMAVRWDGLNNQGISCGTGIYFSTLRTPSFAATRMLILLR